MTKGKRIIAVLLSAVFVIALAACQKTGSTGSKRDSVVIAISQDPKTFDMLYAQSMLEGEMGFNIYDNLLFFEEDGTIRPFLAEAYEISPDGLTYTFKLRKGVKFHNGEEMKASDVLFTIEYGKDCPNSSEFCNLVKSMQIVDDYTLKLTVEYPTANFLLQLCCDQFPIYSEKAVKSVTTYGQNPIGTGAYKFVSHDAGTKLEFEAFQDYFLGAPPIKRLIYKVLPDPFTAGVALETGDVDLIWSSTAATIATLKQNKDLVIKADPSIRVNFVSMNNEVKPFSDVRIRRAVNYAIDRQAIVDIVDEGMSNPVNFMAMPWMAGYAAPDTRYSVDLDKAKSLMREAGYSQTNPLNVTLICVTTAQKVASVIQENLREIGINVTLDLVEFNTYIDSLYNGNYQMAISGYYMVYKDMNMMTQFYLSDMIDYGNSARYVNPAADALLKKGDAELVPSKRVVIYKEFMDIVQNDAVYAVYGNPNTIRAHHKDLNIKKVYSNGIYVADMEWK